MRPNTAIVAAIPAALAAIALLVASLSPATAAGPSIGRLGVGGTGCPAGTVSASLTGGGSTRSRWSTTPGWPRS